MMKYDDITVMKAISICFKPYLKSEEAMIYCNLGRTQLTKKCEAFGVFKNANGYYKRADLDLMLSASSLKTDILVKGIKL